MHEYFTEDRINRMYFQCIETSLKYNYNYNELVSNSFFNIEDAFKDFLFENRNNLFINYIYKHYISPESTQFVDLMGIQYSEKDNKKYAVDVNNDNYVGVFKDPLSTNGNTETNERNSIDCTAYGVRTTFESIDFPFESGFYRIGGTVEDLQNNHVKADGYLYIFDSQSNDDIEEDEYFLNVIDGFYFKKVTYKQNNNLYTVNYVFPVQIYVEEDNKTFSIFVISWINDDIIKQNKQHSIIPENSMVNIDNSAQTAAISILIALAKIEKLNSHPHIYRYREELSKQKYHTEKGKIPLRKIVHVYLDKENTIPLFYKNHKLIRDYSWMVRGHYRRMHPAFIGKNSKGIRNQKGRTWVVEHKCGNSDNIVPSTVIVQEQK